MARHDVVAFDLSPEGKPIGKPAMVRPSFARRTIAEQYREQLEREKRYPNKKLVVQARGLDK